jgi:hypothetical protein
MKLAWVAVLSGVFGLCGALHFGVARADGGNSAVAEVLFEEGRELLEAGRVTEACKRFAESHRLDPATGTLLGLALCHEQEGKLASAWAEFVEVESSAARERQADRETFAHDKAAELRPRLSKLTISVVPETAELEGLRVTRNGVVVGAGTFNVAAPIDGGEYTIAASAPGKTPWSVVLHVASERASETVQVPTLKDAPAAVAAKPAPTSESSVAATPEEPPSDFFDFTGLQWTGVGTAGAGLLALGAGGYFLSSALSNNAESEANCDGNNCSPEGAAKRNDALEDGDNATVFGIAGGVLVGAGVALFLVGGPEEGSATSPTWTLHAGAAPGAAFATVNGRF